MNNARLEQTKGWDTDHTSLYWKEDREGVIPMEMAKPGLSHSQTTPNPWRTFDVLFGKGHARQPLLLIRPNPCRLMAEHFLYFCVYRINL